MALYLLLLGVSGQHQWGPRKWRHIFKMLFIHFTTKECRRACQGMLCIANNEEFFSETKKTKIHPHHMYSLTYIYILCTDPYIFFAKNTDQKHNLVVFMFIPYKMDPCITFWREHLSWQTESRNLLCSAKNGKVHREPFESIFILISRERTVHCLWRRAQQWKNLVHFS